jgi:tetratricopeptide (TPR) repeat protein
VRDRDHPSVIAIEQELSERASEPVAAEDSAAKPAASDAPATPVDNLSHDSCVTRGQALLESGQVMLAKRMFEQALFLRPSSAAAHTGMGYVALEKGRPQLAAEHFLAAARAGNEDALIGLADAYRRLGRPRDALRSYQNYLNRFPNGKQISIARAQVERLSEEIAARRNP